MKTNTNMGRFSKLGVFALAMILSGAFLTRMVDAQEKPLHVSGAGVPKAFEVGHPDATVAQMMKAYAALKAANWDVSKVAFSTLQVADQKYAEKAALRDSKCTAFAIPELALYKDVALYCDLYERQNTVQYRNRTVSSPEGFWLVVYKSGKLERYTPDQIRMYPHPTIPDAQVPIFPGMSIYKASLPKLPYCQS